MNWNLPEKNFKSWVITILLSFSVCFEGKADPIDSLINLAQVNIDTFNIILAENLVRDAEKLLDNEKDNLQYAKLIRLKCGIEISKQNYSQVLSLLNESLNLGNELNDLKIIASAQFGFGAYYETFGNIKKALPYFLKALDSYVLLKDEPEIANIYNKLGLVYYADGNFLKAIDYFFAAFVLFNKHKSETELNAYWVQNCLSNIGLCYQRMYQPKKGLSYLLIALKYCESMPKPNLRAIGVIKTNIGAIYGDLKQYNKAFLYVNEGIKICLNPKYQEIGHGIESIIYLANLNIRVGNYNEAKNNLTKAFNLINDYKIYSLLEFYYYHLAEYNYKVGNFKEAYDAKIIHINLLDSLDKALEKTSYDKEILMHNIEKQKTENEHLINENKYNELLKFVFIGIMVLCLGIFLLISTNLSKSRTKNKKLEELNQQITAQKGVLIELNQKLEKINNNRSYLIQSIAHDLRTPIGNVMSLSNLLEDQFENDTEESEYLKLIHNSCKLSLNIIEDILDQSLIELGKFKLKYAKISVEKLIYDSIDILKFRSESKNINILVEIENKVELNVDEERIKRVLMNIVMNAIKFSSRSSLVLIKQKTNATSCIISISDQGIGMNAEMIEQIFEKNTKAGREGVENEGTIGIGLSIAQSIILEHGGKIDVESKPNSGSTFYVELPLDKILVS